MNIENNFNKYLYRYADLLVSYALNVNEGQIVNISSELVHRDFVRLVVKICYEKGAKHVNVDFTDPLLTSIRVGSSQSKFLDYVRPFVEQKYSDLVDEKGVNLKILGSEYPDILSDLDTEKLNLLRISDFNAAKKFYDFGISKQHVQWTVAACATKAWALNIFNRAGVSVDPEKAEMQLWKEIFKINRVFDENYIEQWHEHDRKLKLRENYLNSLGIQELHFVGPDTDLVVGLSQKALFKGGTDISKAGNRFEPNIPTEEVFTTPDYRLTRGTVKATKPFLINGKLIEGLWMRFEAGKIVEFHATSGEKTFKEYIGSDPGASRLGEVAIVGIDSPIYQSGLVFEEILYDENAACHIAIGSAYKFCISGGSDMSREQLIEWGVNESSAHTDIMISSDQVDVIALTFDQNRVKIIDKGSWCGN